MPTAKAAPAPAPAPAPVPAPAESFLKKAESVLTKLGAACAFVASLVATAKGALPTDVGTAATVVSAGIFAVEHYWADVKTFAHEWLSKF